MIRQIIQILSEPPGSFIYHLITLFALQVVFAISYSRWRRQPDDEVARNMSYAAGGIFLGRLALLIVGIYYGRDPVTAAAVLPPLEQAINTASVAMLVWSLIPRPEQYPRVMDIMLIMTLVLTGVLYLFFAQEWQNQATAGIPYNGTQQASLWTVSQIALLAIGLGYLLFRGRELGALPPIILGALLITYIIHFWNYPEFVPTGTNVAYWIRLGNLIALPLWAVYAYQHAMAPLLASETRLQDSVTKFGDSLNQAAQVIATQQPQRRLVFALAMVNQMFDTSSAAIGLTDKQDRNTLVFHRALPELGPGELKKWQIALADHTTLAAVLNQDSSTELLRDGLGSRQLYRYFEAAEMEPSSALLIHPLGTNGTSTGLLAVPFPGNAGRWSEDAKNLLPGLARFVSQALTNSDSAPSHKSAAVAARPAPDVVQPAVPAAIVIDRVRVQDLEHQLQQMSEAFREAEQKRKQAEVNALAAQKQARYLAAALRTVQAGQESADEPPPKQESAEVDTQNTVIDSEQVA